jgi:cytochrome c biogenesis protein CcmG/thiol:disulfide interchange protein DsbE
MSAREGIDAVPGTDNTAGDMAPTQGTWRRPMLVLVPLALFALLAVLFAFALSKGDPSKLPSALIGKPAPAISLPGIEGLTARSGQALPGFSTADLAKGQPVVVNFWASWCAPCVEEHPLLVQLAEQAKVRLIGVNYKDQPENARRFLARLGNPFEAVGADANGRAAIEWGVYGMPETFVLDGKGNITYKHVGPITRATLDSRILPAIEQARGVR